MSVNIGTESDPYYVDLGAVPAAPAGAISPAVIPEATPLNTANATTLSKSAAQSLPTLPNASNPSLSGLQLSQAADISQGILYSQLMLAQQSYADTVNQILDAWNQQIEIQAELNKEAALKKNILDNTIEWQRLQQTNVEQGIKAQQVDIAGASQEQKLQAAGIYSTNENFINWFNTASTQEKANYLNENGEMMVANYLSKINDPAIQNADLAKAVMPYYTTVMMETLVVNPLATDITTRPANLSELGVNLGISLPDQLQALTTPSIIPGIVNPQINLLLPMMMYTSAAEAALGLYRDRKDGIEKGGDKKIEDDFVDEFGKRTLANTENTDSWLRYKEPNYEKLTPEQQAAVVAAANLLALTTVLIFDVKAQGANSNLSVEEFNSLLQQGVPNREVLNNVIGQINTIFTTIAQKSIEQVGQYYNFIADFINGARLNRFHLDDLRNFGNAIVLATSEIGIADRAPRMRD